jgi:hypothetical protein
MEPIQVNSIGLPQFSIIKRIGDDKPKCWREVCPCSHETCDYGWIAVRYKVIEEKRTKGVSNMIENEYDGVRPCPTCDPERAQIFESSKTSDELTQRLRQRSQFKVVENYDNSEASKTRTL